MSIMIDVLSLNVQEISGLAKGSGKPYRIRKQAAWAFTYDQSGVCNPFPERIEVTLSDTQEPFPKGRYTLSPQSYFVGEFNSLCLGRLVLIPYKAAA